MPVAMTGGTGGVGRALDCRSFWKAGAYEAPSAPIREFQDALETGDFDRARVHHKFLHTNATSHKWAFGDKRCGEMARKLRFFKGQMFKAAISTSPIQFSGTPLEIDDLEVKLGELEAELIEVNANNEKLQKTYNELVEYNVVLQKMAKCDFSRRIDPPHKRYVDRYVDTLWARIWDLEYRMESLTEENNDLCEQMQRERGNEEVVNIGSSYDPTCCCANPSCICACHYHDGQPRPRQPP